MPCGPCQQGSAHGLQRPEWRVSQRESGAPTNACGMRTRAAALRCLGAV